MTPSSRDSDTLTTGKESHPADQEPPAAASVGGSPVFHPTGRMTHARPRQRCEYCNEPYVPTHHRQKYCCSDHANKARYPRTGWWTDHGLQGQAQAIRSERSAQRAPSRPVEIRRVRASDGKRYYARDADALLEEISESEQARPGLWYA